MRLVRPVRVDARGMIQVQVDRRRLVCAAEKAHRAAWPELWPALATTAAVEPEVPPEDAPVPSFAEKALTPAEAWALLVERFRKRVTERVDLG